MTPVLIVLLAASLSMAHAWPMGQGPGFEIEATMTSTDARYPASNCIDGNIETKCRSKHTGGKYPAISIKLERRVKVAGVRICGDNLKDMVVYVTGGPVVSDEHMIFANFVGEFKGSGTDIVVKAEHDNIWGQYVVIQLDDGDILDLNEVTVFGRAPTLPGKKLEIAEAVMAPPDPDYPAEKCIDGDT